MGSSRRNQIEKDRSQHPCPPKTSLFSESLHAYFVGENLTALAMFFEDLGNFFEPVLVIDQTHLENGKII